MVPTGAFGTSLLSCSSTSTCDYAPTSLLAFLPTLVPPSPPRAPLPPTTWCQQPALLLLLTVGASGADK